MNGEWFFILINRSLDYNCGGGGGGGVVISSPSMDEAATKEELRPVKKQLVC